MTDTTAIPRLGEALRELITRAGLRPAFDDLGLDKDLDDLAIEGRPGAHFRLFSSLEKHALDLIHAECGSAWSRLAQHHWSVLAGHIRRIVQTIDVGYLPVEAGRRLFLDLFGAPLILDLLTQASRTIPGPSLIPFLQRPFATWLDWSGVSFDKIEHHVGIDERTFLRWREGGRIERLRPSKAQMINLGCTQDPEAATGWLMMALAAQSMDQNGMASLSSRLSAPKHWEPGAYEHLLSAARGASQAIFPVELNRIEEKLLSALAEKPLDSAKTDFLVAQLVALISTLDDPRRTRGLVYLAHHRARIAAACAKDEEALNHYQSALSALWWNSAQDQARLLDEVLIFSAGTANKVAAKRYWDMAYLLGTAPLPYRELDAMEMRRLSAAFEARFAPRRAVKERLTLRPEIVIGDFELTTEALAHPNRKKKFNHGGTRRTPFMEAVLRGSPSDVQEMLRSEGDVNVWIEESGESALSFALRRADRGGKEILYTLLGLTPTGEPSTAHCTLSPESANRPFGVSRETPLKLAIDLADPAVIRRLVECGANLEASCANDVSALFHALNRFARASIPGLQAEGLRQYLAGMGRPDIHDARRGAISPEDLAATRQSSLLPHLGEAWKRNVFEEFQRQRAGDPTEITSAIESLLACGGNPNRRKLDDNGENWTPTLYAAGIGHLPLFKIFLAHGGNPDLTLNDEGSLIDRRDALWVASRRKNSTIIQYLRERAH